MTEKLVQEGWTVLRFWEQEIKSNLENVVKDIMLEPTDLRLQKGGQFAPVS